MIVASNICGIIATNAATICIRVNNIIAITVIDIHTVNIVCHIFNLLVEILLLKLYMLIRQR